MRTERVVSRVSRLYSHSLDRDELVEVTFCCEMEGERRLISSSFWKNAKIRFDVYAKTVVNST